MGTDHQSYDGVVDATARTASESGRTWQSASTHLLRSAAAANRAALAFFGLSGEDDDESVPERTAPPVESLAFSLADWETTREVTAEGRVTVGDEVRFSRTLTAEDVRMFALASGDTNRLHLDDEFAEDTRFGANIVHGTLVSGLISAALARLPKMTVYLSQSVEFRRPVTPGDRVTAVVEVVEDLGDGRYRLLTTVEDVDGDLIVDGEAVVMMDDLPDA